MISAMLLLQYCLTVKSSSRIDLLLNKMTIAEKVGQLIQIDIQGFADIDGQLNYAKLVRFINENHVGSIMNSVFSVRRGLNGKSGWNATEWRKVLSEIQMLADTPANNIPIIHGIDAVHGATFVKAAALFPQPIAIAASFNSDISFKCAGVTSKDVRAAGINWIFSPALGIGLQPLWSRYQETFGEDPYVISTMGAAVIRGLQDVKADGGIPLRAAACMKHFIGYSNPSNGK